MVRRNYKKLLNKLFLHRDEIYKSHLTPSPITKEAQAIAEKMLIEMLEMQPGIRGIAVMMAVIAILRGYLMKPLRMYFECYADVIMKDLIFTFDQDHWMHDGGRVACAIAYFLHGNKYPHDLSEELKLLKNNNNEEVH